MHGMRSRACPTSPPQDVEIGNSRFRLLAAILRDARNRKSAVADFDPSLSAEVGQARLRVRAPQDEVYNFHRLVHGT
jgi:hypothetical protein